MILVLSNVLLFAAQMSIEGPTRNALFNTVFAVACTGVIKLYVVRLGKMTLTEWLKSELLRSAFVCIAMASIALYLILVFIVVEFSPAVALAGFLFAGLLLFAFVFAIELVWAALKAAWKDMRS